MDQRPDSRGRNRIDRAVSFEFTSNPGKRRVNGRPHSGRPEFSAIG